MGTVKQYDEEFKKQAVKLAKEIVKQVQELIQPLKLTNSFLLFSYSLRTCPYRNWHASFRQILPAQQLQAQIRTCPHRNGAWIFEQILSRTRQNFAGS
mgnify:CR=1 FL=1